MLRNNFATRITCIALVSTWISLLGPSNLMASIYAINQSYTDGTTVIGTITTDGATGQLSTSDILSWQFTYDNPSQSLEFTCSSTDSGASTSIDGVINATPTSLTVPAASPPSGYNVAANGLGLNDGDFSTNDVTASWETNAYGPSYGNPPYGLAIDADYTAAYGSQEAASYDNDFNSSPTPPPTITVATAVAVPEPASLSLLAIGGLALLRRCRRAVEI